ncbi:MAG: hypothetical protein J5J00_15325 [Deltaproteobacteria bacterium]|nr:hypothetical protein [Deltaproteobacteria bacterium]
MDEKEKNWCSLSTTVTKEFHDEIVKFAEREGIKVGGLLRRAVRAYCSYEVQGVASSLNLDIEQLIRKSVMLFLRINSAHKGNELRDRILRLEIWIETLFFHLFNRNEKLLSTTRVGVERRLKNLYKQIFDDDEELRQELLRAISNVPPSSQVSGPNESTDSASQPESSAGTIKTPSPASEPSATVEQTQIGDPIK